MLVICWWQEELHSEVPTLVCNQTKAVKVQVPRAQPCTKTSPQRHLEMEAEVWIPLWKCSWDSGTKFKPNHKNACLASVKGCWWWPGRGKQTPAGEKDHYLCLLLPSLLKPSVMRLQNVSTTRVWWWGLDENPKCHSTHRLIRGWGQLKNQLDECEHERTALFCFFTNDGSSRKIYR